jgi:hypothetical protein
MLILLLLFQLAYLGKEDFSYIKDTSAVPMSAAAAANPAGIYMRESTARR